MLRRILIGTLVAGLLFATVGATPAAVAVPRAQSTTCTVDLIVNFRPGLNLSERSQMIKLSGSLSDCVGGAVTSAMGKGMGSGTLSCTSGVATATVSLRWNTLQTSRLSLSVDVSTGAVTGTVVSGKFAGEEVTADLTLTPLQGDCFFSPVTKAEATGSASI